MKIPEPKHYPKSLSLRGQTYKVVFIKGLKDLGETDPVKREIRIRLGMSKNETFRTILHEVFHFIEFEWPIRLSHKQVYKLEKAVFQLIIDNFL